MEVLEELVGVDRKCSICKLDKDCNYLDRRLGDGILNLFIRENMGFLSSPSDQCY